MKTVRIVYYEYEDGSCRTLVADGSNSVLQIEGNSRYKATYLSFPRWQANMRPEAVRELRQALEVREVELVDAGHLEKEAKS